MNKLKSTFSLNRHNSYTKKHEPTERRRSEVIMKRLSVSASAAKEEKEEQELMTPRVQLEDLSEIESKAYQAWWKDLDPFHIGKADNATVFKFVSGCHLPDTTLEEILTMFQQQKDGLDQEHFFAILRLIAHAQNGKTVNRDIVYLGAPLPQFQTQAIDALIINEPVEEDTNNKTSFDTIASSWNSGISSASHHSSIHHSNSMPSWMIQQAPPAAEPLLIATANNTLAPPPIIHTPIQHGRSKSVPYANTNSLYPVKVSPSPSDTNLYQFDTLNISTSNQQQTPTKQHSSHASLDQDALSKIMNDGNAEGPSLLLTQSFKPQFHDDPDSNVGSSQSSPKIIDNHSNNPYKKTHIKNNPFDTDDSSNSTPKQLTPPLLNSSPPNNKNCFNSNQVPPPPLPPQSTKPPFPKYARRISTK